MSPRARRVTAVLGGVAVAALAAGAWALLVEPRWIEVTRTVLRWRGPRLRLVLLTDLHARPGQRQRVARIVRRVQALAPDVVLLGGDFLAGLHARTGKLAALGPVADLHAPHGVFAVLGNHDSVAKDGTRETITAHLTGASVRLLDNERARLPSGVEIVGLSSFRAGETEPAAAFEGSVEGAPRIVLVHNWQSLRVPGVGPFDLALAGHTHGGQGCVPVVDVCPFLEEDMTPYVEGLYDWPAGGHLYVSRGIGASGVPARFAARPEITTIDLVPEA